MTKRRGTPTIKQRIFIKKVLEGHSQADAVRLAGYKVGSFQNARSVGSEMMKQKAVVMALEKAGLTDETMAKALVTHIELGMNVKNSADTSLKALSLAYQIKGHMDKTTPDNVTQNNFYINELKGLDDSQLVERLKALEGEIVSK